VFRYIRLQIIIFVTYSEFTCDLRLVGRQSWMKNYLMLTFFLLKLGKDW